MLIGVATFSYAIAALAFLLLFVLLVTGWRSRSHGAALIASCAVTMLWGAAAAWQAANGLPWWLPTDMLEVLRNAAWTLFLLTLLGQVQLETGQRGSRIRRSARPITVFYLVFLAGTITGAWFPELVEAFRFSVDVVARVGAAVLGMLLVEQLYRNKPVQDRWAIKFACFGIGGMFAYDFYMFSDAMLFRKINPEIWAARGFVNALTVPLIAISAARSSSWSSEIAVSRRVIYHSATLFGSALYLLIMASAGYYLRFFGGRWGSVMQVAFLFGALVLLAGILFSGSFRAWLKVFISKHFYSYNYDYREEWMRFTRALSAEGPGVGERTIQAVGELVESPGGILWIRRESVNGGANGAGNCEPAAHWHVPPSTAIEPADSPFCRFLEQKQWVVELGEYESDPDLYESVPLPAWLRNYPRAWAVVPLILQNQLFGFVLLITPRSAITLNWEVIDLLKIAGSQAASYLAQQEAANALMVARQFESFNRLSTFVVHDLKNLVSQLSLLTLNAEKHTNNPEFQRDMLDTVTHSVQKMKLMLQKLGRNASLERNAPLAVEQVVQHAVALKSAFEPQPVLEIACAGLRVLADTERLERVIGHIVQNAIEATPKDGRVAVRVDRRDESVLIEVSDTGSGMSEEFIRERLFKPFESTKSAGMGIGAFESREYIHELGGRIDVFSRVPLGTTFKIVLPLYQLEAQNLERTA